MAFFVWLQAILVILGHFWLNWPFNLQTRRVAWSGGQNVQKRSIFFLIFLLVISVADDLTATKNNQNDQNRAIFWSNLVTDQTHFRAWWTKWSNLVNFKKLTTPQPKMTKRPKIGHFSVTLWVAPKSKKKKERKMKNKEKLIFNFSLNWSA